jgi:hypothetical protein
MAQENLIKASAIPYSIVRATQFFEFVEKIADISSIRLAPRTLFIGTMRMRSSTCWKGPL